MSTTLLVIIIVAVVVVIAIVALLFFLRGGSGGNDEEQEREEQQEQERENRRERARSEFGPEYERTAKERGSEDEAADELHDRREKVRSETEPLSDESRQRYEGRWEEVEQVFVDNPDRSIEMADRTITDILEERKFVSDASQSDEETEKRLAVAHPDVADDYREARKARAGVVGRTSGGRDAGKDSDENNDSGDNNDSGEGSSSSDDKTEDLRQALRRYRSVYKKLIEN